MSKIVLPDASPGNSGWNRVNDNFRKIEEEFQDRVLYRGNPSGEPNEMENDLDMNSNHIYNLPEPVADYEPARWGDVKGGVPEAKKWAEEAKESAGQAATSAVVAGIAAGAATAQAERAENEADRAQEIADSLPQVVFLRVDNVGSLSSTIIPPVGDNFVVTLSGYHPNSNIGGGELRWYPDLPKTSHNGGTIFSPTVPYDWSDNGVGYLASSGETDPSGNGCYVRIYGDSCQYNVLDFGARPFDTSVDSYPSIQKTISVAIRERPINRKVIDFSGGLYGISSPLSLSEINNNTTVFTNGTLVAIDSDSWTNTNAMLQLDRGSEHEISNMKVDGNKVANCILINCTRATLETLIINRWRRESGSFGIWSMSGSGGPKIQNVWSKSEYLEGATAETNGFLGYPFKIESGDGRLTNCTGAHGEAAIWAGGSNNIYTACHFFNGSGSYDISRLDPVSVMSVGLHNQFTSCYFDNGYIDIKEYTRINITGCEFIYNSSANLTSGAFIRMYASSPNQDIIGFNLSQTNRFNWGTGLSVLTFIEEGGNSFVKNNIGGVLTSPASGLAFVDTALTVAATRSGVSRPLRVVSNAPECYLTLVSTNSPSINNAARVGATTNGICFFQDGGTETVRLTQSGDIRAVTGAYKFGATSSLGVYQGTDDPEGSLAAVVGSLYLRTGSTSPGLYVKETGTNTNTGWVKK